MIRMKYEIIVLKENTNPRMMIKRNLPRAKAEACVIVGVVVHV